MSLCEFSIVLSVFKQFKALDSEINSLVKDGNSSVFFLMEDYNKGRNFKRSYAEEWNAEINLRTKIWSMYDALFVCMFMNSNRVAEFSEYSLPSHLLEKVKALHNELTVLKKHIFGYDL